MNPTFHRCASFTLVEILITMGVIAVLATAVIPVIRGVPEAAKKEKLEQDVVIVNNAIDAYLAAGGEAANLGADTVIGALKQRVSGGVAAQMMGPQGPFLDPRVMTKPTDFSWSAEFVAGDRPRFVVVRSTEGVVFGEGPAVAIGGVQAQPDSARGSWLWSYSEVPPPQDPATFMPVAIDPGAPSGPPPETVVILQPPVITPTGAEFSIGSFPLRVSISNPNPETVSRVYYRINDGGFTLYDNLPFRVDPGSTVVATAVSRDPSRYYNSPASSQTYDVTKLQLAVHIAAPGTVSYAQALLPDLSATIELKDTVNLVGSDPDNLQTDDVGDDKFINAKYLQDANFVIKYTTDDTDPSTSATAQTGPRFGPPENPAFTPVPVSLGLAAWGTNSLLKIRAIAEAVNTNWFLSSPEAPPATVTIELTELPVDIFPRNPVGLPAVIVLSNRLTFPWGVPRIFYRINGPAPLTAEQAGFPFDNPPSPPVPVGEIPSSSFTIMAQATGPEGYEQWFASPVASRDYNIVTVLNPDFVGANVSGGDVNGSFRGSIFVSAPADLGIFNAGMDLVRGNLYVPGLPGIEIPGTGNSTKTVVARGALFADSAGLVPRAVIAGKELSADGQLANPQLDLRQIVDLNGSGFPTNYTVKLTTSSFIEGKIYRNVDVPPPPPVPQAPLGLSPVTNTFSGVPPAALAAGIYSNNITMNSTNSVLRLGVAGSTAVSQYIFSGHTFSKGTVEILGPVEIYFTSGWTNSGVVFGSTNALDQLRVNVLGGDVDLKSDGALYGSVWATNVISVGNGGILFGSIYARTLNVAPGGTVNVE